MTHKIPGVEIALGENTYVVPPLNFRLLQEYSTQLALVNQGKSFLTDPDTAVAYVDVITASLQRNYPDLTRDDVLDRLDIKNAQAAILSILGISGFRASTGDGPPEDVTPMGESTGVDSIAT
jgi:hypothetical protein